VRVLPVLGGLFAIALACTSGSDSGGIPGVKSAQASCVEEVKGGNDCLPGITFVDMDGQAITPDDLRGKVVAVNFWATWCPPCRAEIPALTRFYEQYKDRGFVLLGVMADEVSVPELEEFSRSTGLRYPVIKLDYEVADHFGLPAGFPTTYVYDRTGHLRFEEKKAIRESKFRDLLEELLAEPAPIAAAVAPVN
jgi:cytochrome c biogenesis protein CcmG, thiol:disulfide interchange protein DsbE